MTLTDFLLARIAEDEAEARTLTFGYTRRFPQARVLTECEAKRRIVEIAQGQIDGIAEGRPHRSFLSGRVHDGASILSALALPYAEHPDYREEWAA